jgi:threonine dehydrogenase-like Zn-dependent dehydrogenase
MRAVRNAPPTVEVVEIDEPGGNGELVRVAATGICASDLNYLQYGSTQIAGHEFAGTVDDGTAVAVEPIFGCGACPQCELGSYNRCERGPTALGMMDPGGMCEWFRAPRHALIPLPPGLDLKDALLVEPASVAWHCCHMGPIGPDTRVAVVGAGAIGILAAASAQTMGAPDVAVEARHAHQHQARERIGATTPSGGYDVVVETAGSQSGLHRAVELARPGGTVVYVGVYGDITWPHQAAFMKEVALRPSLG